jgi:hypothetical protein
MYIPDQPPTLILNMHRTLPPTMYLVLRDQNYDQVVSFGVQSYLLMLLIIITHRTNFVCNSL